MRHADGACTPSTETRTIVLKIALAGLAVVLGLFGLVANSQLTYDRMSQALDADIATYKRQRWERPPLRGKSKVGNAAEAAYHAVAGMEPLSVEAREALASHLHYGKPLPEPHAGLVAQHRTLVAALRDAGSHQFSMTTLEPGLGMDLRGPDYPLLFDGALLMVASAAAETEPEGCLQTCTDAIRFGHDLVAGATLEAVSVAMRINAVTAPVLTRCAALADRDTLIRTSRELHTLAQHLPPTGTGLELNDVRTAVELRAAAARGAGNPIAKLRERPRLFEAWRIYTEPTRWRRLSPDDYPDSLETWRREANSRGGSDLPLVAETAHGVMGFIYDDMRGLALLRIMAVGVATLAERARRGKLPREPVKLKVLALRDPFTARPLKWRVAQDASELTIWSIGENLRDDLGTDEWAPEAPLDVGIHFNLRGAQQALATKGRRGRKRPTSGTR